MAHENASANHDPSLPKTEAPGQLSPAGQRQATAQGQTPEGAKKQSGDSEKEVKSSGSHKYYRTRISGLRVQVGDTNDEGKNDPDLVEVIQFQPREERHQGDSVKVGYLETDNKKVHKALENDGNVEEISKSDYEKATS